jgi:hypothetical protein
MSAIFQFKKLAWYPHMMPYDVAIWERFIENNPDAYEKVIYDFPVGSDPDFDTTLDVGGNSTAQALYKKRIDVVGFKGNTIDIIELKPNASASALGQVLGYVELYKRDVSMTPVPRPVLITDKLRIDMEEMALALGVTIFVA